LRMRANAMLAWEALTMMTCIKHGVNCSLIDCAIEFPYGVHMESAKVHMDVQDTLRWRSKSAPSIHVVLWAEQYTS
jgi:hypothetical protein